MPNGKGRKRARLAEAQNWRCAYCAGAMDERGEGPSVATLEHVHPRSRGGSEDRDNLVVACGGCNGARPSSHSALRFFEVRQRLLADGCWPACESPSKSILRSFRALAGDLNRKELRYSVEEVLDHLAQHHPGCASEFRNALAHRASGRRWREATIGMAVGITMTEFIRDTLTDFSQLRQGEGLSEGEARERVRSQISEIIGRWRMPPAEPSVKLRLASNSTQSSRSSI